MPVKPEHHRGLIKDCRLDRRSRKNRYNDIGITEHAVIKSPIGKILIILLPIKKDSPLLGDSGVLLLLVGAAPKTDIGTNQNHGIPRQFASVYVTGNLEKNLWLIVGIDASGDKK